MEYSKFYTIVKFDFYITPTEYSFWKNNVRLRKLSRFEPHSTPRINVGKVCDAFDNVIHVTLLGNFLFYIF